MSHPNRLSDMNPARLEPEGDGAAAEYTAALHHIRYQSDDGAYTVADFITEQGLLFTAMGTIVGFEPGDHVLIGGEWTQTKYGKQLRTRYVQPHLPQTAHGIIEYLSANIECVGPKLARAILDTFGSEQIQRILDEDFGRLREVKGVGEKKFLKIKESWDKNQGPRRQMIALQGYQISPAYAGRIIRQFGDDALRVVRHEPYRLADEIPGIGFQIADRIARQVGFALDSPERVTAGLSFVIQEAENNQGHCYLPLRELLERAARILEVNELLVAEALKRLLALHRLHLEQLEDASTAIFRRVAWQTEADITADIGRFHKNHEPPRASEVAAFTETVARLERVLALRLADEQRQAVELSVSHPVMVVTGGPGTGKTTLVRILVAACNELDLPVCLAAPTGRAAKRLTEATGAEARTLHRLLEFSFQAGGFQRNRDNPLEPALYVIDEASMIDIYLMRALLKALPDDARLVIVGDVDQLPSVGPGSVLADLIGSKIIPVVRLNNIFRQAAASLIVRNAHRVNRGEMPIFPERDEAETADFFMLPIRDSAEVERTVVNLVCNRLPKRYRFDPLKDIQVLCPMRVREVGSEALNRALQAALNPSGHPLNRSPHALRVGDRVMQLRNNYEKDVYNGDVGRVCDWNEFDKRALIQFDDREVSYSPDELSELSLAYACTVHKAQGSEYPAVVIPLVRQHHVLLQRHLLYTALTRARRLVVIVGDPSALRTAVSNEQPNNRFTRLAQRLRDCLNSSAILGNTEEETED